MFEELRKLFDVLEKIEALHAGATTPGERHAAASARDRIMERLHQFERSDEPIEQKFTLVNQWSMRLFCALAKRYDLKPYRYFRQRYTTVMLRCPEKFVDEVLWPEFEVLDETLMNSLNEVTDKLIAESIFQGSTDVEVRDQALLGCDAVTTRATDTARKQENATRPSSSSDIPKPSSDRQEPCLKTASAKSSFENHVHNDRHNHVGRNDPCPCGSGKKYKKCCLKK